MATVVIPAALSRPWRPQPLANRTIALSCFVARAQQASPTDRKERKKGSSSSSSSSAPSSSRQRDFEDGMLIWDDVFEKCCEEPERVSALMSVAERGLREHGRGCVFVREFAKPVAKGAGTGFLGRSRPLKKSKKKPAFYKSERWVVDYVPRKFIIDPSLAPEGEDEEQEGSASAESKNSSIGEDFLLVRRRDLMSVLRGMDRTRVLSLTSERIVVDSITARSVQKVSEEEEMDAGGEEPYLPSKQELVLLLHVDFDGMPSVGADVLQAFADDNGSWKLRLRDFQLYQ